MQRFEGFAPVRTMNFETITAVNDPCRGTIKRGKQRTRRAPVSLDERSRRIHAANPPRRSNA